MENGKSVGTLAELIAIGENLDAHRLPPENRRRLLSVMPALRRLDALVGLKRVKDQVVAQVLYYIQRFGDGDPSSEMLHTCIEGSPGCGKTTLGQILGDVYCRLGLLSTGKFVVARRSDLIAGYLGQTAIKTQKVLDEARGGVLFIDEAYSLGNGEKNDSFSKECVDTINRFLTECPRDFVCIVAGYKEALKTCFFSLNPGLERRFPWRYTIDEYEPEDLHAIFCAQARASRYVLDAGAIDVAFFREHRKHFPHAGGDTETFFHKCKISHSTRVFFLPRRHRKRLTRIDIDAAFEMYMQHREKQENFVSHMFM